MKRLIVPRSQRTMKSTMSPSIVVAVAMSAGRGAPGVYVAHAPPTVRYIHFTCVGIAHDGSVPGGVKRSAFASRFGAVHLNTFCHGPENIAGSALSAWLTSSSSTRFGAALPGPGTVAASVLGPSGRPVTTPSSWWFPSGSGANAEVTSVPFSITRTSAIGVAAGTATSTRASPPETYSGGLETTHSRSASWIPAGGPPAATAAGAPENAATARATTAPFTLIFIDPPCSTPFAASGMFSRRRHRVKRSATPPAPPGRPRLRRRVLAERHRGHLEVLRLDAHQVGVGELLDRAGLLEAERLCVQRLLEERACEPGVAPRLPALRVLERRPERLLGPVSKAVVGLSGETAEDLDQLVLRVVGEHDLAREARAQAGVRLEERPHQPRVARDDDDEPMAVVLHPLEQRLDRLVAEVEPLAVARERVRLVHEQDAVERSADHALGLDRRQADVLADEPRAVDLHQVAAAEQSHRAVHLRQQPRDGRLAGAGVPEEDEVLCRRDLRKARLLPPRLHAQERDERAHLLLHRVEAGEGVELREQLLQRARRLLLANPVDLELLAHGRAQLLAEAAQRLERVRRHRAPTVPVPVGCDAGADEAGRARGGVPRRQARPAVGEERRRSRLALPLPRFDPDRRPPRRDRARRFDLAHRSHRAHLLQRPSGRERRGAHGVRLRLRQDAHRPRRPRQARRQPVGNAHRRDDRHRSPGDDGRDGEGPPRDPPRRPLADLSGRRRHEAVRYR